jgi:hypothetical protein
MPEGPIDPGKLQGDALSRWYLRTPADIEQERQAAAARRYQDFFGGDRGLDRGVEASSRDVDPGFNGEFATPAQDIDPGFNWAPAGADRSRGVDASPDNIRPIPGSDGPAPYGDPVVDRTGAGPDDGGELIEIGNPANRRLKREYEQQIGPWPRTEDGRNFHVAHTKAIADGGTNTLDNIRPMHPDAHLAEHMANGDPGRWGRRSAIARAFGGKVEPPKEGARVRGMGGLNPLDLLGIMSGRIRTDSLLNFGSDMVGIASPDDVAREKERKWLEIQRQLFPDCPPGSRCI